MTGGSAGARAEGGARRSSLSRGVRACKDSRRWTMCCRQQKTGCIGEKKGRSEKKAGEEEEGKQRRNRPWAGPARKKEKEKERRRREVRWAGPKERKKRNRKEGKKERRGRRGRKRKRKLK